MVILRRIFDLQRKRKIKKSYQDGWTLDRRCEDRDRHLASDFATHIYTKYICVNSQSKSFERSLMRLI